MRVALVVPHIFMHQDLLPQVIFSPGRLGVSLAEGLAGAGVDITLFSAGPVETSVKNICADLSGFERELAVRGDSYLELLKKHPLVFVSLARQAQSEVIARAFDMANQNELDLVHVYTNEEDIALPFSKLCQKPVVFTHHDPFNFLAKYRHVFPKYSDSNWISMSIAQRAGMPTGTHWIANIPHGIDPDSFSANLSPTGNYVAFLGRIIEPKGLHLAIAAVREYNHSSGSALQLRIAGKHYGGSHDSYYEKQIAPEIDGRQVVYDGYIRDREKLSAWLGNARAVLVPSTFDEPFGMVMIEALACGAPVIGLDCGAIPEVIRDGVTGLVVRRYTRTVTDVRGVRKVVTDDRPTVAGLALALGKISEINRAACRRDFESRFTQERMCLAHQRAYEQLVRG